MFRHIHSLQCWNCIGISCDEKPTDDTVEKKQCRPGDSCQVRTNYLTGRN